MNNLQIYQNNYALNGKSPTDFYTIEDNSDIEEQFSLPDRWIRYYVICTPVFWLLGILLPVGIVLLLWLLLRNPVSYWFDDKVILSWVIVSIVQAMATIINWIDSSQSMFFLFRQLASTTTMGWLLLALAISTGRISGLRKSYLIRTVSIFSLNILIISIIAYATFFIGGLDIYLKPSLLSYLLSSYIPPETFHFTISLCTLAADETFFGYDIPRLVIFFPHALVMGFAGIGIFYVALLENSRFWKFIAITGALIAIIGSLGRVAYVAFIISCLFYFWLRINGAHKCLTVALLCLAILFYSLLINPNPFNILQDSYEMLYQARPESNIAREMAAEDTWAGFLKSPLIGHGWQEAGITETELPTGSHSTIYGLLYTGGVITFGCFCVAAIITFYALFIRAINEGPESKIALTVYFSLMLFTYSEGIQLFVFPSLLLFLTIGWSLTYTPIEQDFQETC